MVRAKRIRQYCTGGHKQEGHPHSKKGSIKGQSGVCLQRIWGLTNMLVCSLCGGQEGQKMLSKAHRTVSLAEGSETQNGQGTGSEEQRPEVER